MPQRQAEKLDVAYVILAKRHLPIWWNIELHSVFIKFTNIAQDGVLKSHWQELKLHADFTRGWGSGSEPETAVRTSSLQLSIREKGQ